MNPTAFASECRRLAKATAEEALRWHGETHSQLTASALQLAYVARSIDKQQGPVIRAVIEAGSGILDRALIMRATYEYRAELHRG